MNLLCNLGIHDWKYEQSEEEKNKRVCRKCGKEISGGCNHAWNLIKEITLTDRGRAVGIRRVYECQHCKSQKINEI